MPAGRPPDYTDPKEMQAKIDQYFEDCKGEILLDADGNPVMYKGRPVRTGEQPPTITGLALALGFTSRQSLLNYNAKPQFMDTITRAKARIEAFVEGKLLESGVANGAKFNLINNFKQWSDVQHVQQVNVNADLETVSDEKLDELIKRFEKG